MLYFVLFRISSSFSPQLHSILLQTYLKPSIRVMKTNLMHCLSSVYFVIQSLHVSSMFVAHHEEVYWTYTTIGTCCTFQLTVCWAGWPTESQLKGTTSTNCCTYVYRVYLLMMGYKHNRNV